jgi:acetyl/propionyl-CoA carboxylase alpha subunit
MRALAEYTVGGIRTNTAFFREVLADPEFQAGRFSTSFLDGFFARRTPGGIHAEAEAAVALVAALEQRKPAPASSAPSSRWVSIGREENLK